MSMLAVDVFAVAALQDDWATCCDRDGLENWARRTDGFFLVSGWFICLEQSLTMLCLAKSVVGARLEETCRGMIAWDYLSK